MTRTALLALSIGCVVTIGCFGSKKYRDYCDRCLDGVTEDGCRALAKALLKEARVLNCEEEFREYSNCVDTLTACGVGICDDEESAFDLCMCRAWSDDASDCVSD